MRTASSQHRTANWLIPIFLAIFMTAAGLTVLRAAILLNDLSSLTTQSRAELTHSSQTKP